MRRSVDAGVATEPDPGSESGREEGEGRGDADAAIRRGPSAPAGAGRVTAAEGTAGKGHVLVRASVARNMESAAISRINMDIAVPQVTGGPPTQGAEECRCPPGYRGFSCEECSVGHYRDSGPLGKCVKCPCNDNEQACGLGQSGRVECRCKDGWGGAYCDSRGEYSTTRQ